MDSHKTWDAGTPASENSVFASGICWIQWCLSPGGLAKHGSNENLVNLQPKLHSTLMSGERQRRAAHFSWIDKYHQQFLDAVQQCGGAAQCTPSQVFQFLQNHPDGPIPGLELRHVKSHLQTERHRSGVPPKNPRRRPNYSHTSDSDQISGSDDEKPTVAPRRSRRSKRQRPIDGTSDHETSDDNSLEDAKSHDGSLRAEKSARTSSGKDKKSLAKSGSHNNNRKSGTKSEDTQKKEAGLSKLASVEHLNSKMARFQEEYRSKQTKISEILTKHAFHQEQANAALAELVALQQSLAQNANDIISVARDAARLDPANPLSGLVTLPTIPPRMPTPVLAASGSDAQLPPSTLMLPDERIITFPVPNVPHISTEQLMPVSSNTIDNKSIATTLPQGLEFHPPPTALPARGGAELDKTALHNLLKALLDSTSGSQSSTPAAGQHHNAPFRSTGSHMHPPPPPAVHTAAPTPQAGAPQVRNDAKALADLMHLLTSHGFGSGARHQPQGVTPTYAAQRHQQQPHAVPTLPFQQGGGALGALQELAHPSQQQQQHQQPRDSSRPSREGGYGFNPADDQQKQQQRQQ